MPSPRATDPISLLSPDSCPACPLRDCNSLAPGSRNSSPFPARLSAAKVDFPERCEGSGYACSSFSSRVRSFWSSLTTDCIRLLACWKFIIRIWTPRWFPRKLDHDQSRGGADRVIHLRGRMWRREKRLHPPTTDLDPRGPGRARWRVGRGRKSGLFNRHALLLQIARPLLGVRRARPRTTHIESAKERCSSPGRQSNRLR